MGVFLDPLIKYYDSDTSTVSWVGSLFVGMEYMAGPIVGGLMNKFGLQKARGEASKTVWKQIQCR